MKREPLRGNDVRQLNEKLILSIIHREKRISQSEVVQITGLKAPTVFRIFSNLEEEGFIRVVESREQPSDRKGRRPVYYGIEPEARYLVGIDFRSRTAALVLVDFAGNPIYTKEISYPVDTDADQMTRGLQQLAEEAFSQSGIDRERVIGIGIGAPGRVNINTGEVIAYPRIAGMNHYPLGKKMEEHFSLPVSVHNNAAVIALAEFRYGVAGGENSLLTVLIRSGVGGSFISDRRIFVNQGKTTLELGHMSVNRNGDLCSCGRRGCLEASLAEDALLSGPCKDAGIESIEALEERFSSGAITPTSAVYHHLEQRADILTDALCSLYQLFSPSAFLIVTRSTSLGAFLARRAGGVCSECRVLSSVYDPSLACIGAADLILDAFFAQAGELSTIH